MAIPEVRNTTTTTSSPTPSLSPSAPSAPSLAQPHPYQGQGQGTSNPVRLHQNAGIPRTLDGPSHGAVVFFYAVVILLFTLLVGYTSVVLYLLAREYPRGRAQRRIRAARAAKAKMEEAENNAGSYAESGGEAGSSKLPPRLIDTGQRRQRTRTMGAGVVGVVGSGGMKGRRGRRGSKLSVQGESQGESYEMVDIDLGSGARVTGKEEERGVVPTTGGSQYGPGGYGVYGDGAGGASRYGPGGYGGFGIENMDDGLRINTLRRLQLAQEPVQENLHVWPTIRSENNDSGSGGGGGGSGGVRGENNRGGEGSSGSGYGAESTDGQRLGIRRL